MGLRLTSANTYFAFSTRADGTTQHCDYSAYKHKNLLHRVTPPKGETWRMQTTQNPEVLNPAIRGSNSIVKGGHGVQLQNYNCLELKANRRRTEGKGESDVAIQLGVMGFVNDAHPALAELLMGLVVADCLADHFSNPIL
jgi:hypothetical protein